MCTVIYYSFDCGHYVTRCQSRCGGTKVKERRDSRRAACTGEGYVTIKRSVLCSKCSKNAWVSRWQKRLEKANRFHTELLKEKLPGAAAVSDLIEELEKAYEIESWELRNSIPHGERSKIRRVRPTNASWIKLPPSPLGQEVQPEEVVLPVTTEPVYDEDDDDWVRSTDPLHPIDTNYELFCAGIDDDYLNSLVGEESGEVAEPEQDNADPFAPSWDWNEEQKGSTNGFEQRDTCFENHSERSEPTQQNTGQQTSWVNTAEEIFSSGETVMTELRTQDDTQEEQIQEVIKAFWDAVNITDEDDLPSSSTASTEDVSTGTAPSDNTTATGAQYPWVDGSSDTFQPPVPAEGEQPTQEYTRPIEPARSNSTATKYDAFRGAIPHPKPSVEYYAQWLVECRLEIREMVGPEGTWIPEPARSRA